MTKEKQSKRRYSAPKLVVLPKAEKIIRGDGLNWTDYLGNPETRYGKDTYFDIR